MTSDRRPSVLPTAALVVVGTLFWISGSFRIPLEQLVVFAGIGSLYLPLIGVGMIVQSRSTNRLDRSPAPTWLRRLRWIALGGLPAAVTLGAISYITTDLSPIPLLWILPASFIPIAWIVSFARVPGRASTPVTWIAQTPAFMPLCVGTGLAGFMPQQDPFGTASILIGGMLLSLVLLLPLRLALLTQLILVALLSAQMHLEFDLYRWLGVVPCIVLHLGLVAATCRSCQGAAVMDAPPLDRGLEFAFCVLLGYFGFALGFAVLPPLIFPQSAPEYAIAMIAALLVRLIPWRTPPIPDPGDIPVDSDRLSDDRIIATSPSR